MNPLLRQVLTPQFCSDELWRRAKAVPSLDLRFADNKSLVDAVTGASLVTFTRASSATYVDSQGVIQTAATDVPRFHHDPVTGESLGLLREEQSTNLLTYSEDTSQWLTPQNVTLTQNATTTPSGASTADQYLETVANGLHVQDGMPFAFVTSTVYTYSVSVQAIGDRNFEIGFPPTVFTNRFARFTLSDAGAVQGTDAGVTATIQSLADGWYRCTATSSCASGASARIGNFINNPSYSRSYTGDTSKGIFIWAAQLEAGASPTSYIPTTTAAATRSADVPSFSGTAFSSWYRQDEGTMFAEVAITQPASGGNQFIFRASNNSFNNSIALNVQSSGFASIATSSGGVSDGVATSAAVLTANTFSKIAAAYIVNNLGLSLNGSVTAIDTSATIPTALSRADIGSDHTATNQVKAGTIRRLVFWPQRLPDGILQAITQ